MKNEPNLFIVGAPKCGTTALSRYLQSHSNIFISKPKEPNYFCTDIPRLREFTRLEEYLEIFKAASPSHKIIGEASTIYLHSNTAIPLILENYPNAKFIAMVRNPLEMIYSWHSQLVYNGYESEINFERAWRIQNQRRENPFFQYSAFGRIGERLKKAIDIIPPKQLNIILFDDFKLHTKNIYREVLSFLDIPNDGREIFDKANENKVIRSQLIANFIRNTPAPLVSINLLIKKTLRIKEFGILERMQHMNDKKLQRTQLPKALKQEMVDTFKDDIELLSTIMQRDLSYWLDTE